MALGLIRDIYTGTRSVIGAVKDADRARQIALIVGRHGFAQLIEAHQASREQKAALRAAMLSGETAAETRGVDIAGRLVNMIEELGPTFIKFGQILSSRSDLLPADYVARMESLQDRVSPLAMDVIRQIITDNLGKPPDALFARFDETPIAAASIGQVHGALTHDGHDVVVKVQRPGLRAIFEADLSLLRFLVAQALEIFPEAQALDPGALIAEMESNLLRETDFNNELQALKRFGKNFADNPNVHIPEAYADLSTSQVLVMERIVGSKLTAIADPALRGKAAVIYVDAAYQMVFKDGLFHGDLHPGNVFLQPDGKLGLIDFGMIGRLSRQRRDQLIDVIFALTNNDVQAIARQWYVICRPGPQVRYDSFETAFVDVLEARVIGREVHEIELAAFFSDLASVSARLGVRVPGDFMMLFKAMATTEGLARQLAPDINPVEAARPYVMTLIKERYSPSRLRQTMLSEASRLIDLARELPYVVERLIGQLERGESRIRVDQPGRDEQLDRLVRAGNRGAVAMLAAAAAVTGALTLGHPGIGQVIAGVAFSIAIIGVVWVAWGIVKRS